MKFNNCPPCCLIRTTFIALAVSFCVGFGVSCKRDIPPPTPLSAEEMPGALQKAYEKASGDTKDFATQVNAALGAKDYQKAYNAILTLSSRPGLSKDQRSVVSRAMLTINQLLQTAAENQGDAKAAQALKTYRVNK
jgi:hypothetical protein